MSSAFHGQSLLLEHATLMPFAIIRRGDLNAPEMFIEVDETWNITPTGTPVREAEVRVLLRRDGMADPDIDREIEQARRREV
jgi:hypothetical protein